MNGEIDDLLGPQSEEETAYFQSQGATGPAEPPPEAPTQPEPPAAPPSPQPEPPAAPAEPGWDATKYVPLPALQEERRHRQELQRRLEEMERRLNGGQPPQPDPNAAAAPAVDVENDPVGALKATIERVQAFEQALAEEAMQQRFIGHVVGLEQQFVATTPDYGAAMQHLVQARDHQLQLFGVTDPRQRAAILAEEARTLSANALQAGENPAARAYALAQALGYQKAAPAASAAPPAPNPAEKIDALKRTAAAAGSLAGGSGSAPPAELTAEVLAGMSDEEFEKLSPEQFRKAMGG